MCVGGGGGGGGVGVGGGGGGGRGFSHISDSITYKQCICNHAKSRETQSSLDLVFI